MHGWIHAGKNFITDLWKVDFNQLLSSYGGHEFFGQPFEDAMSYILPYLDSQLNSENTRS